MPQAARHTPLDITVGIGTRRPVGWAHHALPSLLCALPGHCTTRWGPRGAAGLVGSPPWPYTSQTSMLVSCKDRHRQARACDQVRTWQGASGGMLHDSQPL